MDNQTLSAGTAPESSKAAGKRAASALPSLEIVNGRRRRSFVATDRVKSKVQDAIKERAASNARRASIANSSASVENSEAAPGNFGDLSEKFGDLSGNFGEPSGNFGELSEDFGAPLTNVGETVDTLRASRAERRASIVRSRNASVAFSEISSVSSAHEGETTVLPFPRKTDAIQDRLTQALKDAEAGPSAPLRKPRAALLNKFVVTPYPTGAWSLTDDAFRELDIATPQELTGPECNPWNVLKSFMDTAGDSTRFNSSFLDDLHAYMPALAPEVAQFPNRPSALAGLSPADVLRILTLIGYIANFQEGHARKSWKIAATAQSDLESSTKDFERRIEALIQENTELKQIDIQRQEAVQKMRRDADKLLRVYTELKNNQDIKLARSMDNSEISFARGIDQYQSSPKPAVRILDRADKRNNTLLSEFAAPPPRCGEALDYLGQLEVACENLDNFSSCENKGMRQPQAYAGARSDLPTFMSRVLTYLKANGRYYQTPETRATFIYSLTDGDAYALLSDTYGLNCKFDDPYSCLQALHKRFGEKNQWGAANKTLAELTFWIKTTTGRPLSATDCWATFHTSLSRVSRTMKLDDYAWLNALREKLPHQCISACLMNVAPDGPYDRDLISAQIDNWCTAKDASDARKNAEHSQRRVEAPTPAPRESSKPHRSSQQPGNRYKPSAPPITAVPIAVTAAPAPTQPKEPVKTEQSYASTSETRTCHNCQKPGHLASNCTAPKKNRHMYMASEEQESDGYYYPSDSVSSEDSGNE